MTVTRTSNEQLRRRARRRAQDAREFNARVAARSSGAYDPCRLRRALIRSSARLRVLRFTERAQQRKIPKIVLHKFREFVQLLTKKHVATAQRIDAKCHATPTMGIVFLFCWRGFVLVSQLREDKLALAPEPLYGG